MKDNKIFKKWWFWVIVVVIVLGAIGSLGQSNQKDITETTDSTLNAGENSTATLPKLNPDDYKNKEGLVVYKELKGEGYKVDATFENQALTDINGKASDLFEPLDPNNPDDKQSVDAFKVGHLVQDDNKVVLTIIKTSN